MSCPDGSILSSPVVLSLGGDDYPLELKGLMAGAEEDPEQVLLG